MIVTVKPPTDTSARLSLHDWATHLPVIIKMLDRSQPEKLLELGSGDFSSVLIHEYVTGHPTRHLTSLEHDQKWIEGLGWLNNRNHTLQYVPNWDYTKLNGPWDFVFIDQAPEEDRIPALAYFADKSKIVALHDNNYEDRYAKHYHLYKYIVHHRVFRFNTSIFSNTVDITKWWPEAV